MRDLTDRQREILAGIAGYSLQHGFPPTVRELCTAFGYSSPNAINQQLNALQRKGYISRRNRTARGIVILKQEGAATPITDGQQA